MQVARAPQIDFDPRDLRRATRLGAQFIRRTGDEGEQTREAFVALDRAHRTALVRNQVRAHFRNTIAAHDDVPEIERNGGAAQVFGPLNLEMQMGGGRTA